MSDEYPRVVRLVYVVAHSERWGYNADASLEGSLGDFDYRIANGRATFTPRSRFAAEDVAREALEPLLAAWELSALLQRGAGALSFIFESCQVQARAPQLGVVDLTGTAVLTLTTHLAAVTIMGEYPKPSPAVAVDVLVEFLRTRFERLLADDLYTFHGVAMQTAVITHLGNGEGKGPAARAAAALAIHPDVLTQLSDTLADRGSVEEVRKVAKGYTGQPLTDAEKRWLHAILRQLLERAALATLRRDGEIRRGRRLLFDADGVLLLLRERGRGALLAAAEAHADQTRELLRPPSSSAFAWATRRGSSASEQTRPCFVISVWPKGIFFGSTSDWSGT